VATRKPAAAKGGARKSKAGGAAKAAAISLAELRKIPAFAAMTPADAEAFLETMQERSVAAGEPLFRESSLGDGLFVVLEGRVGIFKRNAKGGEREVAILERNEVLGEMDLISDRPHTTGARVLSDGRLLFLPKGRFQEMLRRGNAGAASMVVYFARMLAGRLDANNRRMLEVLDAAAQPASSEFSEFKRRLLRDWSF
jgi:CRP-like cAMP-binding protein